MRLIWTKSSLPLSKLIRWGLNEPVSHFAIVLDDKLVFHSNLTGCKIQGIYQFTKTAEIVHSIHVELSPEQEEAIYQTLLQHYEGRPYDFGAFYFFTLAGIRYRFFGTPMPKSNPWGSDGLLCVELVKAIADTPNLPPEIAEPVREMADLDIISPQKLYETISASIQKRR